MNRRHLWLPMLAMAVLAFGLARPAAARPLITGWSTSGSNVTVQVGTEGRSSNIDHIDAQIGEWSGGFGPEPAANSVLSVAIDVNGHGGVALNYQIQTTDTAGFDWLDIVLVTNSGAVPIVTNYNPNPTLFSLFVGPVVPLLVDLTPYKGQSVTLIISSHQDGVGDQFQTLVTNLHTVAQNGTSPP